MEIISFKRGENEGALFIHGEKKNTVHVRQWKVASFSRL